MSDTSLTSIVNRGGNPFSIVDHLSCIVWVGQIVVFFNLNFKFRRSYYIKHLININVD